MRDSVIRVFIFCFFVIVRLAHAQTQEVKITPLPGASGITLGKAIDFAQDKYGFLWIADQTKRCILRYDGTTMKRYNYDEGNSDGPNSLGGYVLNCLVTDDAGGVWIGGNFGVDYLDSHTGIITHFKNDREDPQGLGKGGVSDLLVDHQGTGLGLSLSYDIVKSHGGVLTVDTKEGEYTVFVISLPSH